MNWLATPLIALLGLSTLLHDSAQALDKPNGFRSGHSPSSYLTAQAAAPINCPAPWVLHWKTSLIWACK